MDNKLDRLKLKKRKPWLMGAAIVALSLSLVACHSEPNPLLKAKPKVALHWLYAAQWAATKKAHVSAFIGSTYVICVKNPSHFNNPFTGKNHCSEFLEAMVSYAKKSPGFKNLTLSDLKDPAVIKRFDKELMSGEG